ncbi:MAG: hypothetical protein FGM27_02585 [Candidatus Omnitrophica bacterium]|nr:hypothetical protein [Candidatus Omnitrophota bacterium]
MKFRRLFLLTAFVLTSANSALKTPTALAQESAPSAPIGEAVSEQEQAQTKVSLDFKDADIHTVLRVMSIKSGMNIVSGPEVQGNVSIRLEEVEWQKALDVLLRTYGYVYERDDNVIRITTRENLAQEPVATKTFILDYSKAQEIADAVKDMLTERGRVKVAERTNMIVVTDVPTNLYRIEEVIRSLDKQTPQAYIDSKVVRTGAGVTENLGIQWNLQAGATGSSRPTTFPFTQAGGQDKTSPLFKQFFPTLNDPVGTAAINPIDRRGFPLPGVTAESTFEYGTLDFTDFSAILQMLQSSSNTKVVSNPRVVVLNNQPANIQVGSDIPLPTFERNENTGSIEISGFSYREVGVVLNVTPHINSADEILVDLMPEVSNVASGAGRNYGGFFIPEFTVTKAKTQVLIESGQTIAIGGLLSDNVASSEAKVPYLSDLPILGKAFRSKRQDTTENSKVETLFFITVTMVDTEGQPAGNEAESDTEAKDGKDAVSGSKDPSASPDNKDQLVNAPAGKTSAVSGQVKEKTALPAAA